MRMHHALPHRLLLLTLHQHHVLLRAGAARQQLSTVLLSYLSASAACAAGGPLLLQLQQALAQYLQGALLPALQHSGEAVPRLLAATPVLAGRPQFNFHKQLQQHAHHI
jgi:hypothetical protein